MLAPADASLPTFIELLHSVAARNEAAFASLYDQTNSIVHGLALRILGNQADADEVTLDVYLQVWRTAGSYSSDKSSPLGWLLMLTRSRAIDRLRSRAAEGETAPFVSTLASTARSPEVSARSRQEAQLVNAFMAELPQEQRMLIQKAFFQGMSHSELAVSLELPLGTVKTRMRLGLHKLRDLMAAKLDRKGAANER